MNCQVCGQQQHDPEAKFCQECGVALARRQGEATLAVADTLPDGLRRVADLAALVAEKQPTVVPQPVVRELRAWAAANPRGEMPTVVVMGEYRRGKSTVVNRLLGQPIAEVRLQPEPNTLRIGQHPHHGSHRSITCLTCDAPLLQHVDLVDTPAISRQDDCQVAPAIQWALTADAILFCLDARQMLSASERKWIQHELLPLTQCPILLTVSYLDQVLDEQDQQELRELLIQFVSDVADPRLQWMMLPPGKGCQDALPDLLAWIQQQVSTTATVTPDDQHQRVRTLLTFLEQSLPDSERESRERLAQQREETLAILNQAHRLAMMHAVSLFRQQCSYLRGDLKAILKASEQSTYGFEAFSHVVQQLSKRLQRCGADYLSDLQHALRYDGAAGMRHTSESVNPSGTLTTEAPQLAAPHVPKRSSSNWKASMLEAAMVAMAVAQPGLNTVIGGAVGLIAASSMRQANRQRAGGQIILRTEHSLQTWLSESEPQLFAAFTDAADQVFDDICQQLVQRFEPSATPLQSTSIHTELRQAITACYPLLPPAELSSAELASDDTFD